MAGSYEDGDDGEETGGGGKYDGDGGDVAGKESTECEAAQQQEATAAAAAASVQFSLISSREFVSSFLRAFLDRFSQFFSISDTGTFSASCSFFVLASFFLIDFAGFSSMRFPLFSSLLSIA